MEECKESSLESTLTIVTQTTESRKTLAPDRVEFEKGESFFERYQVLNDLGKGTYGIVRKVKKLDSDEFQAAKFIKCIKPQVKEKAKEEIEIMNCLKHPILLKLNAAFVDPKEVIMVTEYVSGGELYERVVAKDFTLTEKDSVLFVRQICEGVGYMHEQNIVHLDLKPENIMCRSPDSHHIKIVDFGLAQKITPDKPIRVLCGTAEFISPEIVSYEPIGPPSDMWSVGVICYVLLSGKSPFRGANKSETYTKISTAQYDFDDKAFDNVSELSKNFISSLLVKTKEDRLTAGECLKHEWLARHDTGSSGVVLSTDELKRFVVRRKWHVTGDVIRALGRMNAASSRRRRRGDICATGAAEHGGGTVSRKLGMESLSEEEDVS